MSRKQRRSAPRGSASPTNLSPEAIELKAQKDLASGRYREATAGFKRLLKIDVLPVWRAGLADAYAGRARELAGKGMLKEALVMWENRSSLGDGVGFEPDQVALLLRMGRLESVLDLFEGDPALSGSQRDLVRPYLAVGYLAGNEGIARRLAPDDPVLLHGRSAHSALDAYCAGDDAALQAALAEIPFRSPYRDWVQILKALQRLPHAHAEAAAMLARVREDSAFGRLRRAAELALVPEAVFPGALAGVDDSTANFACALRGWPTERLALWKELHRLGDSPKPEPLLRFMHRHRDALGEAWVHQRALRLLIAGYPASVKTLTAMGAAPVTSAEGNLLAAWSAELHQDMWVEHERWERYGRFLIQQGAGDGEVKLRIALAFRRCDFVNQVLSSVSPSQDADNFDWLVASLVEESLTWDPDDRDTYLRLIRYYRRGKRLTEVRRHLERAASIWPKDMQVLGAALDTALDAGAFKKAAGLAREMLALDPINSGVRGRLVEAHLAHARKQVIKGRADLARKELAIAGEWARGGHAQDQIDLTAGLIALIDDAETGAPVLRDTVLRLGGGLSGRLELILAGEGIKLSTRRLLKAVGLERPSPVGRDDLLMTLARLRAHLDGGGRISRELGDYLAPVLSKTPWAELSRGESEVACDTLRRCGLHQVRQRVAGAALKRWKGEPIFELHAFEAKYPSGFKGRGRRDIWRLEDALERAREAGDTRTAMRIEEVLARLSPFGPGPFGADPFAGGPMPFPPLLDMDTSDFAPDAGMISAIIGVLGLDKALNMLQVPPEMKRDLKDVARRLGNQAAAETLASFLGMIDELFDVDENPPAPRPPPRRPTAPKGRKTARRTGDNGDQDDDAPDQLDLFS